MRHPRRGLHGFLVRSAVVVGAMALLTGCETGPDQATVDLRAAMIDAEDARGGGPDTRFRGVPLIPLCRRVSR